MLIPHLEGFDHLMTLVTRGLARRDRFLRRTSLREVEDHREEQKENNEYEKTLFLGHGITSCRVKKCSSCFDIILEMVDESIKNYESLRKIIAAL